MKLSHRIVEERAVGLAIQRAIIKLEEFRKIPQFFYNAPIGRLEAGVLRNALCQYVENGGSTDEIDLILHSGGGDPNAAYVIIKTLRSMFAKVNIVVPLWAKSAATLLTLGASEIILDSFGEFGPLDAQIAIERNDNPSYQWEAALTDESSLDLIEKKAYYQFVSMFLNIYREPDIKIDRNELAKQILHYLSEFYAPMLGRIDPYRMGENSRKLEIAEAYGKKILNLYTNLNSDQIAGLVEYLAHQCPDHGYIIDEHELRKFGLNVQNSLDYGVEYEKSLRALSELLLFENVESDLFIDFVLSSNFDENGIRRPQKGDPNLTRIMKKIERDENARPKIPIEKKTA